MASRWRLPWTTWAWPWSELGNISERRLMRLTDEASNTHVLPAFLTPNGGLNSGFMIVQYTAAALATENKVLSHPASVDTIPTSANVEDHVSMGCTAALKARAILDNVERILALELMAAAQGIDFRKQAIGAHMPAWAKGPAQRTAWCVSWCHLSRPTRCCIPTWKPCIAWLRRAASSPPSMAPCTRWTPRKTYFKMPPSLPGAAA